MSSLIRKFMIAGGVMSLTLLSGAAFGGSTGGTLGATITISTNCSISSTTQVDFGTVDPTLATNAAGTGSISVKCTKGTTITDIVLDGGANHSGSTRQMSDGAGTFVAYALYTDAAHTTLWGDGVTAGIGNALSSGFSATSSATTAQTFNVYGQVLAAAEDVPANTYNDTVNITVNF